MRNIRKSHALAMTLGDGVRLRGLLSLPDRPAGLVIFAHARRHQLSHRDRQLSELLREAGLGTLLFELHGASPQEAAPEASEAPAPTGIEATSRHLIELVDWAASSQALGHPPLGLLAAGTGAAAALICAAERPRTVRAVVCRSGRPDMAREDLARVQAPTLLIVGQHDEPLIELQHLAAAELHVHHQVSLIAGAGHLLREPAATREVADLSQRWFHEHLRWSR